MCHMVGISLELEADIWISFMSLIPFFTIKLLIVSKETELAACCYSVCVALKQSHSHSPSYLCFLK